MASFLLLFSLFPITAGYNCYSLSSLTESPPTAYSKTIPCSTNCYKSTTVGSGDDRTTYGCDTKVASYCDDIPPGECRSTEIGVVTASVCCCKGELCNSSSRPFLGLLLLIFNRLL